MTMRPDKSAEVLPSLLHEPDWPERILRGTPVLLSYLDNDLRFRYANETHRTWLNLNPERLLGRRVVDVIGERNYQRAGAALEKALAGHLSSYEGELFN